ncbi:MAG: polysaccharide deacetylase family protein [Burkholderiales bacterium]|nr:polysaccharide deacetylase family protein [Burkholderiales bacterium]
MPRLAPARVLIPVLAITAALAAWLALRPLPAPAVFPGLGGPAEASTVASAQRARWQDYTEGGEQALAILLTDPDSAWMGLAHGLKTIGLPFIITTDAQHALRHRVVMVYPTISGRVLDQAALQALAVLPRNGGTLIGFNVEGGGLEPVFGFEGLSHDRSRTELRFNTALPVSAEFSDPHERVIPINPRQRSANDMGVVAYTQPKLPALASYDNGAAAITHRPVGTGHAYAFGIDLGFFLLKGYNNREQGVTRHYANGFEPTLDVLLRLLRNIYRQGEPDAVTLATVPRGRKLSVVLTYDIDYTHSLANAAAYAEAARKAGVSGTHFVQTKYIRDWNDDAFLTPASAPNLQRIAGLGMEIGSHSVSHSRVFSQFPLGNGKERYPDYQPFVFDATTTRDGTILGELRVSRFLLGHLAGAGDPVSFRPGHLEYPFKLPQALEATGFRYSSSITANTALTHLPFRLAYDRDVSAQTGVYEFPITVEDELGARLGDRLPQALELAGKIERYGGLYVVLIHPNITGHKLEFQNRLIAGLKDRAWFGTLREFGGWWVARDAASLRVSSSDRQRRLQLTLPQALSDLALEVPAQWRLDREHAPAGITQSGNRVLLGGERSGRIDLQFTVAP